MEIQRRGLDEILSRRKVLFYGIGNQFKECVRLFEGKVDIVLFDKYKYGTSQGGRAIRSPSDFDAYYEQGDAVVISSINNQYEIATYLVQELGVFPEDLFSYTSRHYEDLVYLPDLVLENEGKVREAYGLLEDSASREYWKNSLLMRISRQPLLLKPNPAMSKKGEYKDILELERDDVIIDCGAYTGDTAEMYIERLGNECFVHAVEPLEENFLKLEENIQANRWGNVRAYHCAVGDKDGTSVLRYESEDFKMGISLGKSEGALCEEVDVRRLDGLFADLPKIDYVKMDIEGQEVAAIKGATEILAKKAPKLMISGYHKLSDFWEIPCLVKKLNPAYRVYVGHAPSVSTELEYYCKV